MNISKLKILIISIVFLIIGVMCSQCHGGSVVVNQKKSSKYELISEKHLVKDYPAFADSKNINVVVEIPTGTNGKWEVDKASGNLMWEFKNGKPRIVNYLGYPGNYGMVPRTSLPKELGGDGDPLDVLIIGSAIPRGSVVEARPIGILKLLDGGEQDDKIIAVWAGSEVGNIKSIEELNEKFNGVMQIIEIWFSNYKGPGEMVSKGFGSADDAYKMIKYSSLAYKKFD